MYIGDTGLDGAKAATSTRMRARLGADPPARSLVHERSWADFLVGHWTFDEGAGSTARDKSILNSNNGSIFGAKFASGRPAESGLTSRQPDSAGGPGANLAPKCCRCGVQDGFVARRGSRALIEGPMADQEVGPGPFMHQAARAGGQRRGRARIRVEGRRPWPVQPVSPIYIRK